MRDKKNNGGYDDGSCCGPEWVRVLLGLGSGSSADYSEMDPGETEETSLISDHVPRRYGDTGKGERNRTVLTTCGGGRFCLKGCLSGAVDPKWYMEEGKEYSECASAVARSQSSPGKRSRFAEGTLLGHGVCSDCMCLVLKSGHYVRCAETKTVVVMNDNKLNKKEMQVVAILGDRLMEYHFVTLSMRMGKMDGYQMISSLFSNAKQKEFAMLDCNVELRKKYFLVVSSGEHTCGTAVEAEYQLEERFRAEFIGWLMDEIGWVRDRVAIGQVVAFSIPVTIPKR